MKISKFFSGIFGVLGAVLAVGTVVLSLRSLEADPVLLTRPEAAEKQAEALMEAVCVGNYAGAGKLMYGTPELGVDREPADEAGALIWDAFLDSIRYEFTGDCYATDSGVARDVTIESLDIAGITGDLKEISQDLLAKRVEEAEDIDQIYDADGEYREDFVMEVLSDAVRQALEQNSTYSSREITLNLTYQDGQWWIVADEALLEAISGGIAG